jgi:hypothetical protein
VQWPGQIEARGIAADLAPDDEVNDSRSEEQTAGPRECWSEVVGEGDPRDRCGQSKGRYDAPSTYGAVGTTDHEHHPKCGVEPCTFHHYSGCENQPGLCEAQRSPPGHVHWCRW